MNKKIHVDLPTIVFSLSFFTIGVHGVSNEVLHNHALVILRVREVLSTIVEVLKKCHGPVKAFQQGKKEVSFPLLKKPPLG